MADSKTRTGMMDSSSSSSPSAFSPPNQLKRKISQKNSGILEPLNVESEEDHFLLSILDPYDNRVSVWCVRALLFWGLFVLCGYYITFGYRQDDSYWAIGLGAVCAYSLCLGAYIVESYWFVPYWYRDHVGKPMVHWMSWSVFLDIIYHVVNPRNHVDARLAVFLDSSSFHCEDNKDDKDAFFVDFAADVGDGFNATYSVFSLMAKSVLTLPGNVQLPRANVCVVGGDICYPWPRYSDMMSRFIRPLSWAFPEDMKSKSAEAANNMYVMPGNHEYADGLRNFTRLILNRTVLGGWTLKNTTPYFAIKLVHGYWMFCVDPGSELCQDLDEKQVEYFSRVIRDHTLPEHRFILCVHEPDWIKNSLHGFRLFKRLALFRLNVLGSRLLLSLAGDLHYYRRMEESEFGENTPQIADYPHCFTTKRQLVVSGHGGAFSHPTYVPIVQSIRLGEPHVEKGPLFDPACDFPTAQVSQDIFRSLWATGFSFGKNHGFGSILGLVYVGMCLAVSPLDYSNSKFPSGMQVLVNASYMVTMLKSFWFYPSLLFLAIVFLVIATTSQAMQSRTSRAKCVGMFLLHLTWHVMFVLILRKLVDALFAELISLSAPSQIDFDNILLFCFLSNTVLFLLGFFLGPWLTAVYLFLATKMDYYNEPWSSIEYQDKKGFLRMQLKEDSIDLFCIGIDHVPRKWEEREERSPEFPGHFKPHSSMDVEAFIVERVTILRKLDDVAVNLV